MSDKKTTLPWDLAKIKEWYPWQKSIFASLKKQDDKFINVLVDEREGGIGKSQVVKFAAWHKWAGPLPAYGNAADIIQAVYSMGPKPAYMLDTLHFQEQHQQQLDIYRSVEQVKDMGSPVIWVFSKHNLDDYMLSERWRIFKISEETNDLLVAE